MIDQLRMPEPFAYPNAANMYAAAGAGNVYGEGRIPHNLTFGDRRGRSIPPCCGPPPWVARSMSSRGVTPLPSGWRPDQAGRDRIGGIGPWTGAALTESQWSTPDAVGPAFGAALQSQGLMPRHRRYNPQTRAWEATAGER